MGSSAKTTSEFRYCLFITIIMKVFIVLALISFSSAAKLAFEPFTHEFSDCGGSRMTLASLDVQPDPVPVPGTVTVNAAGEVTQELTGDGLKMKIHMVKVKPVHMDVPCVDQLGSCTYDVCTELVYPDAPVCAFFPADIECKCPLPAAALILDGSFEATIKLYNEADGEDKPEGCVNGKFT